MKMSSLRGEVLSDRCPSRHILSHVTGRWSVLVLFVLKDDTKRFAEIRREIGGISEKMLAETLKRLEGDGFVRRKAYRVVPPKVEYSLTPLGKELCGHIFPLIEWLEENTSRIVQKQTAKAS